MQPPKNIEQRLTELEIKASFGEDATDQLNQVIVRQQQEIAMLIRAVEELRQHVAQQGNSSLGIGSQELPPHY